MSIHTKVIWITGASSGIGSALAIELSKLNCQLILSSRSKEGLMATKNHCFGNPDHIAVVPLDLGALEQIEEVYSLAYKAFGIIDILINNAGISQRSLTVDTNLEVYSKIMSVNFLGTVAITKAVLPDMLIRNSGQIVTITSLVGKFGTPLRSGYAASKHALHGFFDSLRAEVSSQGIDILLVCPGFIQTDISRRALTGDGTEHQTMDSGQSDGMHPLLFSKKLITVMQSNKEEVCIGGKETFGVLIKRLFPNLFSKMIQNMDVV